MPTTNRTSQDRARRADIAAAAAGAMPPTVPWIPPNGTDSQMQPAGIAWDAVRAPSHLARPALAALGDEAGAVIRDPYNGDLYWLLPPGAVTAWEPLPQVTTYGTACYVEIPPTGRTGGPGPYWIRESRGRHLTRPAALHAALATAVGGQRTESES
ncbi:hypothetical protein [Streptomyces sp. AA1529]|uniref:hypothetical protein n=1 Tax=Streptomyces sp. AA1529 TaxID=1203257 RepID=UPI003D7193F0